MVCYIQDRKSRMKKSTIPLTPIPIKTISREEVSQDNPEASPRVPKDFAKVARGVGGNQPQSRLLPDQKTKGAVVEAAAVHKHH